MDIVQVDKLPGLLVALAEDVSLAPAIKEAWRSIDGQEVLSFLGRAAMIYHLSEVRGSDGLPLFNKVQLSDEPPTTVWPVFCLSHLGIAPSTASNYKKLWQTYVVDYGASVAQLATAGVSKLVAARKTFAVTHDERLVEALFGDPVATYAGLLVILNEMRQDNTPADVSKLRCDVEESAEDVTVLLTLVVGSDEYYLPSLTVPFDSVPSELVEEMVDLLRRKFG